MYRIDNATAASILPTPKPAGTPGFFTPGTIGGELATIVEADWMNTVQEELVAILGAAGVVPDKTNNAQVIAAILALIGSNTRKRLTATLDLYCAPPPLGNDANNGLTPATPFATPPAAYNLLLQQYDLGGQTARINLANGAYAPFALNGAPPGLLTPANLMFIGNIANPGNVTISQGTALQNCFSLSYGGGCTLEGISFSGTAAQTNCIKTEFGSRVFFQNLVFGPAGGSHTWADWGSSIMPIGNYSITGGAASHFFVTNMGQSAGEVGVAPMTISLIGGPAFSTAFCYATDHSFFSINSANVRFSGSATGPAFLVNRLSQIDTSGGGLAYFPGSAAGTADASTFGLYT